MIQKISRFVNLTILVEEILLEHILNIFVLI